MKKGIIVLVLVVGSTLLLSAYERDGNSGFGRNGAYNNDMETERQRLNVVSPEDCELEGDLVGTGYLNNESRKYQNQSNSERGGRNRKN